MEKRLLLAFVLSLAVFIGWGAFMAQFQPPPVEQTDEQPQAPVTAQSPSLPGSSTPPATSSGAVSSRPQSDLSQPMVAPVAVNPFPGEEKKIRVDVGKTHYVFSNRGGVLKQILLPRFNNDDGDTINLIDNPDNLTSALSLKSDDAEIDQSRLNLSEGPKGNQRESDVPGSPKLNGMNLMIQNGSTNRLTWNEEEGGEDHDGVTSKGHGHERNRSMRPEGIGSGGPQVTPGGGSIISSVDALSINAEPMGHDLPTKGCPDSI